MYLLLREMVSRLGDDELVFFQTAYYWRFQKHHDCVNDVCQYRLHALIPKYVEEYVNNIGIQYEMPKM